MYLIDEYKEQLPDESSMVEWKVFQDLRSRNSYCEPKAVFTRWNHPLTQSPFWGSSPLYYWQRRLIHYLSMVKSRAIISTNNASGKTAEIIPLFGLSVMTAFPGAVVFSTAGVEEQLRGQLWKYLGGKVRPYEEEGPGGKGWIVKTGENLEVWGPKIDGIRSRWIGRVPAKALTMEGYHGFVDGGKSGKQYYRPVCLMLDEAKALGDKTFEAAHRIDPDWMLVISTPGNPMGPFFDGMDIDMLQTVRYRDNWEPKYD